MRKYRKQIQEAKPKAVEKHGPMLAGQLPLAEFMAGLREDIETFAAELGLIFMRCVMAAEIEQKVGAWGGVQMHRHGQQPGYVIFAGRKIRLPRPRLRNRQKEEVPL